MKFPSISVITAGPALGHDCMIDATTLQQVLELGNAHAPLKVFADHNETVTDLIGGMSNFRLEGDQVKADLETIEENPLSSYYAKILDIFPESLGFSIAWTGSLEQIEGVNYARVAELTSCDLVAQPAANPTGIYSSKIRTHRLRGKKSPVKSDRGENPDAVAADSLPSPVDEEPGDVETGATLPVEGKAPEVDNSDLDTMSNPTAPLPTPSTEEALSSTLKDALAPIHTALSAIHDRLAAIETSRTNPNQYEDEEGEDEGMSAKLSAKLDTLTSKLSVLENAGSGTAAVATTPEVSPADLVAQYEGLTGKAKVEFAKKNFSKLKAVLPKTSEPVR